MKTPGASAPGKVVLCGEYAVLEGAPAVSMAVDRRARVRLETAGGTRHRVASSHRESEAVFRAGGDGAIEWLDAASGDFALLEHVWREARPAPGASLSLNLDTRDFFRGTGGPKLGFGSSAALAVALTAALGGAALARGEVYRRAARAHRSFQNGRGSGIDVATAVYGGVIGFRMEERVEPLEWPQGLALAFLWSGRPSDTATRLERFSRSRARAGRSVGALVEAAGAVRAGWSKDTETVLESLRSYAHALRRFGRDCELGIFEAGHDVLYAEAAARGIVYKPCGAGGGDVGAVFARSPQAVDEFARWAAQRGFERLSAGLDEQGVTTEVEHA